MRLRQRVDDTVRLYRASLTDPTLSLVTFADLHTSLDTTLTAAGVPDGCDMARHVDYGARPLRDRHPPALGAKFRASAFATQ